MSCNQCRYFLVQWHRLSGAVLYRLRTFRVGPDAFDIDVRGYDDISASPCREARSHWARARGDEPGGGAASARGTQPGGVMRRRGDRYVNRLLKGHRPRGLRVDDDLAAVLRTAIDLLAAGAVQPLPRGKYVAGLRRRLRRQQAHPQPAGSLWIAPVRLRRRRFLTVAAVAATAGAGAVTAEVTSAASAARKDADLAEVPGTWQAVADAADLPEGGVLSFDLGSVAGFVRRQSGRLAAVSGYCTHQGCRLTLSDAGPRLVCPCHGATFALTGIPLERLHGGHMLATLPRISARTRDGRIEIYAPAPRGPTA